MSDSIRPVVPLLGHPPMDLAHRDCVGLAERLMSAPSEQIPALLQILDQEVSAHFSQELRWMEECGAVPLCHLADHDAVRRAFELVGRRVAAGERDVARALACEFACWLREHAEAHDRPLLEQLRRSLDATGDWRVRTRPGDTLPGVASPPASECLSPPRTTIPLPS